MVYYQPELRLGLWEERSIMYEGRLSEQKDSLVKQAEKRSILPSCPLNGIYNKVGMTDISTFYSA